MRAHRRAHHLGIVFINRARRQQHASAAGSQRRAQHRAQVAGIAQPIQHQEQAVAAPGLRRRPGRYAQDARRGRGGADGVEHRRAGFLADDLLRAQAPEQGKAAWAGQARGRVENKQQRQISVQGFFKQAHAFEAPLTRLLAGLTFLQQSPYQFDPRITQTGNHNAPCFFGGSLPGA